MTLSSRLLIACTLLTTVVSIEHAPFARADTSTPQQSPNQPNDTPARASTDSSTPPSSLAASMPHTAVVLRFAVSSSLLPGTSTLSLQACPQPLTNEASSSSSTPPPTLNVEPKILDAISEEMRAKLAKKTTVLLDPTPADIPVGSMVIGGCITKANPGSAAKRLIGMNVGASRLSVHVLVSIKTARGWKPMDGFDIQVKGGSALPPLGPVGLAVHAARDRQQTLSADAKKLADKILKQLAKDRKAHEQQAANG